MWLGVCAKLYFSVFAKIDGDTCQECPQGDRGVHATINLERVETKNFVFYHAGDHSVWEIFVG